MELFNNYQTLTLGAPVGMLDLTVTLSAGEGSGLPSGGNYRILIDVEIMLVTGRTGDVLTVLRGQEGTTQLTHSSGASVILGLTAGAIAALKSDIELDLSFTGTGFAHWTSGVSDGAARAVNLASADVTGVLDIANGGTNLASTGAVDSLLGVTSPGVLGYFTTISASLLSGGTIASGLLPSGNLPTITLTGQVTGSASGGTISTSLTSGNLPSITLTGNVTGSGSGGSISTTVVSVNGATIPAAGSLVTGNAPYVSGASALTYSALNLAGGSGWITGDLPIGNIAPGAVNTFLQTNGSSVVVWAGITASTLPTITLTGQVTGSGSGGSIATTLTSGNLPTITLTGQVTGSGSGGSVSTTLTSANLPSITLTGQVTGSNSGGTIATTLTSANLPTITLTGDVTGSGAGGSITTTVTKISGASPIDITPSVLSWLATTASPTLSQISTSSGAGATLTIQAQTTSAVGQNGGILSLVSGAGTTSTNTGMVEIWNGAVLTDTFLNYDSDGCGFSEWQGVGSTVPNPRIYQYIQAGTGANAGYNLKLNAQGGQLQTGAAANNNGGNLYLAAGSAGTGGSGASGVSGTIHLQLGGADQLHHIDAATISPTTQTFGINPSNTSTVFQVGGSTVLTISSVGLTVSAFGAGFVQSSGGGVLTSAPLTLTGDVTGSSSGGSLATTVGALQGNTITAGALTEGQFLIATSTSNWAATSLSQDVSESATTPGQLTVNSAAAQGITFTATNITFANTATSAAISTAPLASTSSGNGTNGIGFSYTGQVGQAATGAGNSGGNGGGFFGAGSAGGTSALATGGAGGVGQFGGGAGGAATGGTGNGGAGGTCIIFSGAGGTSSGGSAGSNGVIRFRIGGNAGTEYLNIGTQGQAWDQTSISIAGSGTTTLTPAQYIYGSIIFTGAITGASIVAFPNLAGTWDVDVSQLTGVSATNTLTFKSGTASTGAISVINTNSDLLRIKTGGGSTIAMTGLSSAEAPTGTGLWYNSSGALNGAAITLTGDVSQGALSGSNVPLTVTGLQGSALPSLTAGFLQYTGSAWSLASITSAQLPTITLTGQVTGSASGGSITTTLTSANLPTITLTGDVTGANSGGSVSTTVGKIQGNTVTSGALTEGQFLIATSSSNWAATSLSQDVSESATTPGQLTVTGLQAKALPSLTAGALQYTGSAWVLSTLAASTLTPGTADQLLDTNHTGTAAEWFTVGGDLTYASHNFTVAKIQGNTVTSGALTKGQFFIATSTSNWAATSLSQDVSESATTAGQLTVTGLQGSALPSLTAGFLQYTGSAWTLASITSAQLPTITLTGQVTGSASGGSIATTLAAGSLPTITLTGDVTGSGSGGSIATTVGKLQGNTVTSGALTKGQFFIATSTTNWAATSLSQDVSESATTPGQLTVTGLQAKALPSLAAGILQYTGSAWTLASITSGQLPTITLTGAVTGSGSGGTISTTLTSANLPTITLTGDVTGSGSGGTVATTVGALQGNTVTSGALTKGDLFIATSTSNWAATAVTGDVSFSPSTPGSTTVTQAQNGVFAFSSGGTQAWSSGSTWSMVQTALASTSAGNGANGTTASITAQDGQAATGGTNNGGAGGVLILSSGAGGTAGSGTAGADGNILLQQAGSTVATVGRDAVSGAVGVLILAPATTLPTSAQSGNSIDLYSTGETARLGIGNANGITFSAFSSNIFIQNTSLASISSASGAAGNNMSLTAQSGQAATGASHNGGAAGFSSSLRVPGAHQEARPRGLRGTFKSTPERPPRPTSPTSLSRAAPPCTC
jgi:hypothetical protein